MTSWRDARRADKLADRDADRADRQAEREEARRDAEAARRRKVADEKAAAEARAKRRQERAAQIAKLTGWVTADPARAFVRLVQFCSVVPAVISQVAALDHADVFLLLAVLLAAMLEGTAWALVAMGAKAEHGSRSTRTYRVGAWLAGAVAAAINFAHGWQQYPDHRWVAAVLALSSLVAVWLTDLQTHGGRRPTRAERKAAAKQQRLEAEKAEAERQAREEHARKRAEHEPQVREIADRLLSAAPYGALAEDDAWRIAWEHQHGVTVPGLTADLLARRIGARARVAEVSTLPAPADLWPGLPDDPHPALTLPITVGPSAGPADSVYLDTVPGPLANAWSITADGPESLGGKGLQAPEGTPEAAPVKPESVRSGNGPQKAGKPLDPEHLERVRELADLFESAGRRISTADVKHLLGGGRTEYLSRLRRAIEAERDANHND
ncbi:hypothetical protein [Kitasatospora sp. A2-31]|uniref:hypothetical protein n=1 Tax=Kitasatospora sp. A2-31 TaxID=2916414 RepID=UPI001EEB59AF|nr:hypothetical protein [Kitasatospora sp. A2-31]MCG6497624.1 hypothetical protein [Kitasatospora sp. A2-31]